MRYIGSKVRVADAILDLVGDPVPGSRFVDGFCGTGVVAERAAGRGWAITLNDTLTAATTLAAARMANKAMVPFSNLGGYEGTVRLLDAVAPIEGFLWREYSPASARTIGIERRYFTEENAAKIDGMRRQVQQWSDSGLISGAEERLLLADLLATVNSVANIAGTYGCFLRKFTPSALQAAHVRPRKLFPHRVDVATYNLDVLDVPAAERDVAYFDPPYTKRQYAAYYHLLETVTVGDEPTVGGITGLRPWQEKASDYCYKKRALAALLRLLATTPARRVVLSYSSEGHVALDELVLELEEVGDVEVHPLGGIGRYRPNRTASTAASWVNEYLVELVKSDVLEAAA